MIVDKNVELTRVEPEYVYMIIPKDYVCVYHRILAMLADYGEQMLKDCKAACTDRNSGVIECFNMFNSAVAARKLGNEKLATLLINYVKAKINQIYKGEDNSTSLVYPVDENGMIKACVSCGETPMFWIKTSDMHLYEHKFGNGFDEHFKLGIEDGYEEGDKTQSKHSSKGLVVTLTPYYELGTDEKYHPCADVKVTCGGYDVDMKDCIYQYYFDQVPILRFDDVTNVRNGLHIFTIVLTYKGETTIVSKELYYGNN